VSGDSVAGESYLQHAEHYNRIIMANQVQQQASAQAQGEGMNGSGKDRQNAPAGGDGAPQPDVAPVAAPSDNAADEKVESDAPAKTAKKPAVKKASDDNAGDDDGLTRMMARPTTTTSGNGADKEKPADAASDDTEADEVPDEAVT